MQGFLHNKSERASKFEALSLVELGGDGENRTHDRGFADPCLTTWRRRPKKNGAEEGTRTPTPEGTAPSRPRVYQFHHLGIGLSLMLRLSELLAQRASPE